MKLKLICSWLADERYSPSAESQCIAGACAEAAVLLREDGIALELEAELIVAAQMAIIAGLPFTALRAAIWFHPTMVEGFNTLFGA